MIISKKKRLEAEMKAAREVQHEHHCNDVSNEGVDNTDPPKETVVQKRTLMAPDGQSQERIRLSCDITRTQHRKLRMEAARTDRTILEVVEQMIESNLVD